MNDPTHDSIRDDLPAFALDALDAASTARVRQHLDACAECRAALREYREVLRLLPFALTPAQPSPAARATLLERARGARPARARITGWTRLPRARLLAVAVLAALMLVSSIAVWQLAAGPARSDPARVVAELRDDPDVWIMPMTGSADAPNGVGQLLIHPGDRDAALIVSGLPILPTGRDYQFWFIEPDETRTSGAVFDVDDTGGAAVLVDAPSSFDRRWRCGVSEEPEGGSPQPTGRNVLRAAYGDDYEER